MLVNLSSPRGQMPPAQKLLGQNPTSGLSSLIEGSGRNLDRTGILSIVGIVEPQEDENDL